ncbi:MAG: ThiF family adenylyltransferase [Pseudorhodoplanes sp.]|nr:ThiF family adenylyltransferase [Pseudorhodoplanes sp.]
MSDFSLTFTERDEAALRAAVFAIPGTEGAAYVLFRECRIGFDPWSRRSRVRLLAKEIVPIAAQHRVSASAQHVTWNTAGFVELLQRCQREGLVLGIAHSHPLGVECFSPQDDGNEAELLRTACNRNGRDTKLVSVLFTHEGKIRARVWQYPKHKSDAACVSVIGERFRYFFDGPEMPVPEIFARQVMAFGPELVRQLRGLRVLVVGGGGTGSPTAMLLARAGTGQVGVLDDDIVEATNLNRLHGATQADADAMAGKADVVACEIARLGLGCRVIPFRGWVNDSRMRDVLKSCDVIFCCTDDHSGRVFLNRFAHFYLVPVIDMGLAMSVAKPPLTGMADLSGRVTVVFPPEPCLLCRDAIDLEEARAEDLRRSNPTEDERQKREAYVRGGGNPNPAVVTFTTELACMAVNELLNRIVGFRKKRLGSEIRRRFLFAEDRFPQRSSKPDCPICASSLYWGIGDIDPFLDMVS